MTQKQKARKVYNAIVKAYECGEYPPGSFYMNGLNHKSGICAADLAKQVLNLDLTQSEYKHLEYGYEGWDWTTEWKFDDRGDFDENNEFYKIGVILREQFHPDFTV